MIRHDNGSSMPLVLGTILTLLLFLLASLAMASMARERVKQQATADLAAMAGANSIGKSIETARLINGTIWARNVTLDAMYLAATIATLGSAGAGAEAFAIPLRFQQVTIKPVESLERVRAGVERAAVPYAVANSIAVIKANSPRSTGAAVPFPLTPSVGSADSQRQRDLKKMISVYDRRIEQAQHEMEEVLVEYKDDQARSHQSRRDAARVEGHDSSRLLKLVRERSGRVGGLTTQRNRRRSELAKLAGHQPFGVGGDGVVAIVYHPDEKVPFTAALGGVGTGNNIAVGAATVVDQPPTETIGGEAVAELLGNDSVGGAVADGVKAMTVAVNLFSAQTRSLPDDYGLLGSFLNSALDKLGLVPPSLSEVRPTLTSVENVVGESPVGELLVRWSTLVGAASSRE